MTSKRLPLLLSVFSIGIIVQNCFVNINLTRQNAVCQEELTDVVRSEKVLRERLNETQAQALLLQSRADKLTIEAARRKAERAQLLDSLKLLRGQRDELMIQTGEVQMKKEEHPHQDIERYVEHLLQTKKKLIDDITKTKYLLKVVEEGNYTAGVEGLKNQKQEGGT